MSDYTKLPIAAINKYIWGIVTGFASWDSSASVIWNPNNYESYIPFYPVTENLAPESATLPYILYDYRTLGCSGTFWPLQKEEAQYIIVGEIPQIYYVKNFIVDVLEKFDESARNLNEYINSDFNFKYITVDQDNFIADERRIDSFLPKYITCLTLTYEYTK